MKISELKGKHDHALTSWLKVSIFSLLMIAPLFASISQWVYVTCNKNAKDNYSGQFSISYKYESNDVNNINDLHVGNIYKMTFEAQPTDAPTYKEICFVRAGYNITNFNNDYQFETETDNNYIRLRYNNTLLLFSSSNYESLITVPWSNITFPYSFDFVFNRDMNIDLDTTTYKIEKTDFNIVTNIDTSGSLDNAFYYGVEKMTESDLFNWTQNTAVYTGIKTMTDNLEIQTPAIAILLTYWFILTIIYVIIDIVLKGFTTLTHLIMGAKN